MGRSAVTFLLTLSLAGCTRVAAPPVKEPPPAACVPDVPESPLRRLQPEQYLASARDILRQPALSLPLAPATGDVITLLEVDALNSGVEAVVQAGSALRFAPCDTSGAHDVACAKAFIEGLAGQAFRRPLTEDERAWLLGVYTRAKDTPGVTPPPSFRESLDVVAQVILQSPQMVYRVEEGVADDALASGLRRATGYERGARLSFLLWNTTPDDGLLRAAAAGELDTEEGLRLQAQRLLDSPRARQTLRTFASSWLALDASSQRPALEDLPKSADRFPQDSPELRAAMRTESEALFERTFFDEQSSFQAWLTSTDAYVDGPLAALYGVEGPTAPGEFQWVKLAPSQRAGALTRAAFLTAQANQDYASPIHRGVHLFRQVLCQQLGPPPPAVDNTPPLPATGEYPASLRGSVDLKTSAAECQACHSLVNPLGHTLGNYDALGAWQTQDTGTAGDGTPFSAPIDAAAQVNAGALEGWISGPIELSSRLAANPAAQDCFAERFFARAMQRPSAEADRCGMASAQARFRESGDMRELLLDLVTSPSLQLVRPAP